MRFTPLSTPVLGAATVVSAPALWLGLVARSLPLDVALTRYLVAVVLCWAALSVVASFAFPEAGAPARTKPAPVAAADEAPDGSADAPQLDDELAHQPV
jgi:hypothetical protein